MPKFLKENHPINFIKDSEHPVKSANTKLICAWLTCGGKLMDPHGFSYTVEKNEFGEPKINVTWLIDGSVPIEFETFVPAEKGLYKLVKQTINFQQFQSWFRDSDWALDNDNHPLAYVYFYRENLHKMIGFLKKTTPAVKIKTGKGTAIISHETPEHIKKKILNEL